MGVGADKLEQRGEGLLRFGQANAALANNNVRVLGLAIVPARWCSVKRQ